MFFIDPVYFWYVLIPVLVISAGVQLDLKSTINHWSQVRNSNGANGLQVSKQLFAKTSLTPVPLERVSGSLSDHFDPGKNVVRLSDTTAPNDSVAAMAIAAHELGHVQQYQTGSGLIKARGVLLPALQFSPTISYICILFGLMFNLLNLLWIGILFFGLMVLFSLLTIPVELDASRRGLRLLEQAGLTQTDDDRAGSRKVLRAAAMTYLAAAVTSILQLLYLLAVARSRA